MVGARRKTGPNGTWILAQPTRRMRPLIPKTEPMALPITPQITSLIRQITPQITRQTTPPTLAMPVPTYLLASTPVWMSRHSQTFRSALVRRTQIAPLKAMFAAHKSRVLTNANRKINVWWAEPVKMVEIARATMCAVPYQRSPATVAFARLNA